MSILLSVLAGRAGVASRAELMGAGVRAADVDRAVRSGQILRVRRGWFALPSAVPDVVTAVRVGGALTCISALRHYGIWVPRETAVHVAVPANASRLRLDGNPIIHWSAPSGATTASVAPIADALAVMAVCQPREATLIAIDSALNRRIASFESLTEAFAAGPEYGRRLLHLADSRHDSGLETMACSRLRALGIRFSVQVQITGVGRVDVLIGECLVLELDGREFHSRDIDFDNDRRRDLLLAAAGYLVLRVSYRQMTEQWDEVERVILSIVRRQGHMRPRKRSDASA